ncbi:MAG TPA: acyltransferase [Acidimicrobiales bacterium]|nr:acyltransferase [Acidimicrobiales bacterium]
MIDVQAEEITARAASRRRTFAAAPPDHSDHFRARLGRLGRHLPATNAGLRPAAFWEVARRLAVCRSLYYSARFRGRFLVARGTRVITKRSSRVEFGPRGWLLLGFHHDCPAPTLLNLGRDARLVVRGTVQAWRGSQLMVLRGGCLDLGDRVIFNEGSRVTCCRSVALGDGSGLSWGASVLDTDLHPIYVEGRWVEPEAPVRLGDHVMVGAEAVVLKGVHIDDGAIVAAGAVVTRDVPARCLAAGNPARVVRREVDWR